MPSNTQCPATQSGESVRNSCVSAGDSQRVAVACDDGALRIFEAQPGVQGLQYVKSFPRTDGRVLSAAWHPDTKSIVTGTSSGVMHVWDMQSNQELQRITAGQTLTLRLSLLALQSASKSLHFASLVCQPLLSRTTHPLIRMDD